MPMTRSFAISSPSGDSQSGCNLHTADCRHISCIDMESREQTNIALNALSLVIAKSRIPANSGNDRSSGTLGAGIAEQAGARRVLPVLEDQRGAPDHAPERVVHHGDRDI